MGSFPAPVDAGPAGFCRKSLAHEQHPRFGPELCSISFSTSCPWTKCGKGKVFEVPRCHQRTPRRTTAKVSPWLVVPSGGGHGSNISSGMGSHRRSQWWNSTSGWEILDRAQMKSWMSCRGLGGPAWRLLGGGTSAEVGLSCLSEGLHFTEIRVRHRQIPVE